MLYENYVLKRFTKVIAKYLPCNNYIKAKKRIPWKVFSTEFDKMLQNTQQLFAEHLWVDCFRLSLLLSLLVDESFFALVIFFQRREDFSNKGKMRSVGVTFVYYGLSEYLLNCIIEVGY